MPRQEKHAELIQLLTDLNESQVYQEVSRLLSEGDSPLSILHSSQKGMQYIGEHYEEGHYYVSGLIMAGEIMRQITDLLLPHLETPERNGTVGLILLGTVEGDIHDIGKDLFKMLLRGTGFRVVDLGVDVAPGQFVEAIPQYKPDIIGLSALLTVAYDSMRVTVAKSREAETNEAMHIPTIIGGGFIDEKVRQYVGSDYWATDAVTGVEICSAITKSFK
ncbi:MAG: hypothetical protein GY846_07985 [Deltaproteobacteria bacterium]|nr:hypothetical protein [Deltaproteobacteria bacterium]